MAQTPAERQTKLESLFEETLGKDEYASLLRGERSVQEYLDAGKRLSFESVLPLVPNPSQVEFSPDQTNCYRSAVQKAFASDEETDWQQIVEDTAAEIADYRYRKTGAIVRVAQLLGAEFYENVITLQLTLGQIMYNSSLVAGTLSLLTENFDVTLIPLCADDQVPVWRRKLAMARVVNGISCAQDADVKESLSDGFAWSLDGIVNWFLILTGHFRPPTPSTSDSDTSSPRVTCYNIEQLLTPDMSSGPWPLQLATSLSGRTSTRLKIRGLLAIGTKEAKISSLILSAAEHARQQKKSDSSINELSLDEAIDIVDGYLREMRGFWIFRAVDFHAIYRWLEDGAALVDTPEVLRWWLEDDENNHLYRRVAMQLRGYYKIHSELPDLGFLEGDAKNKPVVVIEDGVVKVNGKIITDDQIMEDLRKLREKIGKN